MMNLLMWVNYDLDKGLPPPAIIKPKALWSGKQILSLIIPDTTNFERGKDSIDRKDATVVIQGGEIMQGIIHKKIVGSAPGGLIHVTWKDNGPYACRDLLSNIQLLINNWLVTTGFTVGVQDIVAKKEIMVQVRAKINEQKRKVRKITNTTYNGKL